MVKVVSRRGSIEIPVEGVARVRRAAWSSSPSHTGEARANVLTSQARGLDPVCKIPSLKARGTWRSKAGDREDGMMDAAALNRRNCSASSTTPSLPWSRRRSRVERYPMGSAIFREGDATEPRDLSRPQGQGRGLETTADGWKQTLAVLTEDTSSSAELSVIEDRRTHSTNTTAPGRPRSCTASPRRTSRSWSGPTRS